MEAISGKRPLVRHWMHTGFLQISTEKMSKSEGNMVAIRDALERAPAPVWRYLFLSQHYRSPLEFSWDRLPPAASSLERIRTYARAAASIEGDPAPAVVEAREKFIAALEDDLNAPSALAAIFELIHRDNTAGAPSPGAGELLADVEAIFGVGLGEADAVPEEEAARIDELVTRRESLRAAGDYAGADEIRDSLLREGIRLEDGAGGTRWHRTAALAPD